jgi:PAS domain S-box-containing protein
MIIIDASGAIRFTNRQVAALFGYSHDEIIGLSIEHLMPERFRARHTGPLRLTRHPWDRPARAEPGARASPPVDRDFRGVAQGID